MSETDTVKITTERPSGTSGGIGWRPDVEPIRAGRRASSAQDGSDLLAATRRMVLARRLRAGHVRKALLSEPAWDMLLELLTAHFDGRSVSVSSLALSSMAPQSTALRYIGLMEEGGEIVREPDVKDGLRHFLRLSPTTLVRLTDYVRGCTDAGSADRSAG